MSVLPLRLITDTLWRYPALARQTLTTSLYVCSNVVKVIVLPLDQICQIKSHNRYVVHPTCRSIFLHGNRHFTRPHLPIHVLIVFSASSLNARVAT